MKKITLFLCALMMGATTFAQLTPGPIQRCPISISRNNGAACGGEFSGAEIFITFDGCFEFSGIPSFTLATVDGVIIPASEFNTPTIVLGSGGCGPTSGNVLRICTRTNIAPANNLCLTFGSCPDICDEAGGPTPVTLTNFVAARSGNNVNMKWATSTEINSQEFVIQKKVGGNWVDHAVVPSNNRATGSSYSYTDVNNTAKGITEYRLKMVDFGGAFKLSDIRPIKGLSGASDFTVYPNPSNGTAYVALSESFDKSTVQLLDNAGRVLKTETLQANGSTSFKSLTPGYYLIRVKNNVTGEVVTQKLSVIK